MYIYIYIHIYIYIYMYMYIYITYYIYHQGFSTGGEEVIPSLAKTLLIHLAPGTISSPTKG